MDKDEAKEDKSQDSKNDAGDGSPDDAQLLPRGMLETVDEDPINQVANVMGGSFGLVIYDEVHLLQTTHLLLHSAVEHLFAEEKLFLTGTPMINCKAPNGLVANH